jgi:excisionase family DNA binding protein
VILDEHALRTLIEEVVRGVLREERGGTQGEQAEFVSVAEAARRVDVTPATIRDWVGQGRLGRYHAGRELRVRVSELGTLLTSEPVELVRTPEDEARRFLERRSAQRSSKRE